MIPLKQIHQLAFREKLLVMEAIRDDISREEQELEVPEWHKELPDERERLLVEGKARFMDWEEAKRQINEATNITQRIRLHIPLPSIPLPNPSGSLSFFRRRHYPFCQQVS